MRNGILLCRASVVLLALASIFGLASRAAAADATVETPSASTSSRLKTVVDGGNTGR